MRVVIVDDEPRHRKGLANLINKLRRDYQIDQFKNGDKALEFVKDNKVEKVDWISKDLPVGGTSVFSVIILYQKILLIY